MSVGPPVPPTVSPSYVIIAVILLILLRVAYRTFANYRGVVFSLPRTVGYACVYVALGVLFSALSYFQGVSYLLAVPEVLLAVVAAFWSYKYTDRRISFWRAPGGSLFFRGGVVIYVIYLAGFIARLSIDVAFGASSIFSFASGVQLSGAALYGSMATDLLLILGVGLLIGRNIRVIRRYRRIQRGQESLPSAPESVVSNLVERA
jgi:hypothetical protein